MPRQHSAAELADAELVALVRSVRQSVNALRERADWETRSYLLSLLAEASWRCLDA